MISSRIFAYIKWSIRWIVPVIAAAAVTLLATAYLFTPVAKLFSHQHTLTGVIDVAGFTQLPNCTLYRISLFPTEPIRSINMVIHFDQEINNSIIQNGLVVDNKTPVTTSVDVHPPCDIASKSADRDEALTFSVSSDRHEVFIKGHDLSSFDAQTFVAVFYPNYTPTTLGIDVKGEASYEFFGHEFPARVLLIDARTLQATEITK